MHAGIMESFGTGLARKFLSFVISALESVNGRRSRVTTVSLDSCDMKIMLTRIVIRRFYCPAMRRTEARFPFSSFSRATGAARVYALARARARARECSIRFRVIYLSSRVNARAISCYAVTTIFKCMINTGVVNRRG